MAFFNHRGYAAELFRVDAGIVSQRVFDPPKSAFWPLVVISAVLVGGTLEKVVSLAAIDDFL